MPSIYYLRQFYPGSYYHVYNRGANKHDIFHDDRDYHVFTKILSYYLLHPEGTAQSILNRIKNKVPNLVEPKIELPYTLLAYCLMPNHFHLMLRQDSEHPKISNLMRRLSVTYALYYNHRHHHSGAIFQGKYKNVLLTNEYQWLYLSKYIHRNPTHLKQGSELCLSKYKHSSYLNYLGVRSERWLNTSILLNEKNKDPIGSYKRFIEDGTDVGNIEKLALDVDELQY